MGCEVALMLASEYGLDVTLVEMLPHMMVGICTANRGHLIHELNKRKVKLMNCATLESIGDGKVIVRTNTSPTVPDPYNTWAPILPENVPNPLAKPIKEVLELRELEADLVVLATGSRQNDAFYRLLQDSYVTPEIHLIGDAGHPGMVTQAVRAGYRTGISL